MTGSGEDSGTGPGLGDHLRDWRWAFRRRRAAMRYGQEALTGSPVIFGNSFPKSGTHLLAQILSAFPKIGPAVDRGKGPILTFVRTSGAQRPTAAILRELDQLDPGDIAFGHLIADPAIVARFCRREVLQYFALRDPRDVVVSHAHYIGDRATHNVHHEYYKSLDLEERIRVSIAGRPDWEQAFPDIRARYELYLGWLDCPWVCPLHFEELVTDRMGALRRMLDQAVGRGFRLHVPLDQAVARLAEAIDPARSYTYRKGRVGDWQEHFSAEHRALFKETAGDLLIRLGYERDHDW